MKMEGIGITKIDNGATEEDLCWELTDCGAATCGANALIYKNKARFIIETDRVPVPSKWLNENFEKCVPLEYVDPEADIFVLGNNPDRKYHHLCHAYGAYAQSGFKDASILVIDGRDANFYNEETGYGISIGIYKAEGNTVTPVRTYSVQQSLGYMYAWGVTGCGFGNNHKYAGKLMGAASFSEPPADTPVFFEVDENTGDILDGSISFGAEVRDNVVYLKNGVLTRKVFGEERYIEATEARKFNFTYVKQAAAVQKMFEDAVFSLLRYIKNTLPSHNLVLTGGCALNCVCNGKIIRSGMFDDLFIPNMCEDQGNVIGRMVMELGQEVSKPYIYNNVTYPVPAGYTKPISKAALASKIKEGQIVCWFEGGSEYGPRALCHRSILGNPELPWMANRLNEIKRREYWRPLAPVVLDTHFKKFFDVDGRIWFPHKVMLATEYLRPEYQRKFQAVCAPDNSARPQVLCDVPHNHTLYSLMATFDLPILVNTSMNGANEPICETPENAIEFASRNDDVLLVFAKNDVLYVKG